MTWLVDPSITDSVDKSPDGPGWLPRDQAGRHCGYAPDTADLLLCRFYQEGKDWTMQHKVALRRWRPSWAAKEAGEISLLYVSC